MIHVYMLKGLAGDQPGVGQSSFQQHQSFSLCNFVVVVVPFCLL